jgi:hypothetical protein
MQVFLYLMIELFWPFGESSFEQAHAHGIVLLDAAVEYAFHRTWRQE